MSIDEKRNRFSVVFIQKIVEMVEEEKTNTKKVYW